jgi:putative flippase GtrA
MTTYGWSVKTQPPRSEPMTKERPLSDPATSLAVFPDSSLEEPVVVERATPAARASLRALAMAQIEARRSLLTQFVQFGAVGTVGFLVDNAFVYTAHFVFGVGLILAGILSFFVAGSCNWFLNRIWTFKGASRGRIHYEWLRYLATNAAGFILNRGVYIALIATSTLCNLHPVLALAAGSIGGLGVNFMMSRRVVFR